MFVIDISMISTFIRVSTSIILGSPINFSMAVIIVISNAISNEDDKIVVIIVVVTVVEVEVEKVYTTDITIDIIVTVTVTTLL